MIYCLMVSGLPISPLLRNVLYNLAFEMAERRKTKRTFKANEYDGQISTDYRESWIGTVYGTLFSARVDTNAGSTCAEFLINLDVATTERCDEEVEEGAQDSTHWTRFGPRTTPKRLLN